MRKLFRLPYRTHYYIMCGITEDISIKLRRRVTKFMYSMIHSDNDMVRLITAFFLSTEASFLAEICLDIFCLLIKYLCLLGIRSYQYY